MSYNDLCDPTEPSSDLRNSLFGYTSLSSNSLKQLLTSHTYSSEQYDSSITTTRGVWIALAIITLLIYGIAVLNAVWIRLYPHKAKGFWKWCGRPRTQQYKKIFLGVSLILTTVVLAAGIAGAILGADNQTISERAACEFSLLFDQIIQGSPSDKWGGISKSQLSYNRLRDRFSKEITEVNVQFSTDTSALQTRLDEYETNLDLLYNTRLNYQVKSARYTDSPTELIEPEFIKQLGPKDKEGTFLNSLLLEGQEFIATVLASSKGLDSEVRTLKGSSETTQANSVTAADAYSSFGNALSGSVQDMSDYLNENYNDWVYLYKKVQAAFYVFIALSFVLIVTVLVHYKKQTQLMIQISYISWHLMMIWIVVSFFFAAELQGAKKRSIEYCDLFNNVAGNSAFLDSFQPQYPNSFVQTLKTCFFDNGETYKSVGFERETVLLANISQYILNFNPYLVNGQGSQQIKAQENIISQYIQGLLYVDGDSQDERGAQVNLNIMNSWSNFAYSNSSQNNLAECQESMDTWVLNITNCTVTPFNQAFQPSDLFGERICLEIYSLDSGTIGKRYTDSNFAGCNPVNGKTISSILIQQYNGLNVHFDDVRRKFRRLQQFYDDNLNGKYKEMLAAASTLTSPVTALNNSLGDYLDYVSGKDNGIMNNANCAFFAPRLLSANSYLCDLGSNLDETLAGLCITSIFGVIGCIFTYLYFRKLESFKLISYDGSSSDLGINPEPVPKSENLSASERKSLDEIEVTKGDI